MPPHAEYQTIKPGVIYCLKQRIEASGNEAVNPLQPYFLVYIRDDGAVRYNFTSPKQILEIFRAVCQGKTEPYAELCELFDTETKNGEDMSRYSDLLDKAVAAIAVPFGRKSVGNLFTARRQAYGRLQAGEAYFRLRAHHLVGYQEKGWSPQRHGGNVYGFPYIRIPA